VIPGSGTGLAWTATGGGGAPVEDQPDLAGSAEVEDVADDMFEEDSTRHRGVQVNQSCFWRFIDELASSWES
jgi:hypothetical protein